MANNKDYQQIPVYSKDLIEQLDEMVPERCPNESMTDRMIWIYAGKRELIRWLKKHLQATEKDQYV